LQKTEHHLSGSDFDSFCGLSKKVRRNHDNKPSPIIIPIESIEVYESFCGRTMIFYSI
jgi:hypothetical protein